MGKRGATKQRQDRGGRNGGPKTKRTERCPDCEDRGALNDMGLARFHRWFGSRLTIGCDGCGGSGRAAL
jgi:hypothetical protein